MRFNRTKFFNALRGWLGELSQQQVNGLTFILDAVEKDRFVTRIEWLAYMLATTKHETADTFQPIHEYGGRNYFIRRYGSQTAVGRRLGNDTPEEGAYYAGQGDVQLTGETNYEKAEEALRREYPELVADFERRTGRHFDLTVGDQPNDINDPKNAQDPAIAYAIMSYGMRTGMFTGLSLKKYTTANDFDELPARRIINGTDKAELIAGYFRKFMVILTVAKESFQVTDSEINGLVENIVPNPFKDHQTQVSATAQTNDGTSGPAAVETTNELNPNPQEALQSLPTQNAEVIVNSGDNAAPVPVAENVTVGAPAKDGSTASATKKTILGVAVPGFIVAGVAALKDAISQGYISAADVGSTVLSFIRENQKYVFVLIGLLILLQIVKKVFKQVAFLISMITHAIPGWNNVTVVPFVEPEPVKKWWQIWK